MWLWAKHLALKFGFLRQFGLSKPLVSGFLAVVLSWRPHQSQLVLHLFLQPSLLEELGLEVSRAREHFHPIPVHVLDLAEPLQVGQLVHPQAHSPVVFVHCEFSEGLLGGLLCPGWRWVDEGLWLKVIEEGPRALADQVLPPLGGLRWDGCGWRHGGVCCCRLGWR